MKFLLLFHAALILSVPAFSDVSSEEVLTLSQECFSGEIEQYPLVSEDEEVGMVSVNRDCWDKNPDSINRHKGLPGGVEFLACLPGLAPCKKSNTDKDVVYMAFLIPWEEFVTKRSAGHRENKRLVESDGKTDIYTGEDERFRYYVSKTSEVFNVSCLLSEHGSCDMMGLAEGGIQYFLQFHYQEGEQDWHSLHNKAADFIRNAVEFQ